MVFCVTSNVRASLPTVMHPVHRPLGSLNRYTAPPLHYVATCSVCLYRVLVFSCSLRVLSRTSALSCTIQQSAAHAQSHSVGDCATKRLTDDNPLTAQTIATIHHTTQRTNSRPNHTVTSHSHNNLSHLSLASRHCHLPIHPTLRAMARSSLLALLVLTVLSLLVSSSLSQPTFPFTAQTTAGYTGRQQGGLLIIGSPSTTTSVATPAGAAAVTAGSLVIFGGQNGANGINDVWFSSNGGQSLSSVSITASATYNAQSYGPSTCVDSTKQILYSLGGDSGATAGGSTGTQELYYSVDLGQSRNN